MKNRSPQFIQKGFMLWIVFSLVIQSTYSQVTVVNDKNHIAETAQEGVTTGITASLKLIFENPAWREISKVEEFFYDASNLINSVLANLKLTKDLIEKEKRIFQLIDRSMSKIENAQNLPNKGIYLLMLVEIYSEAISIFEIFDIGNKQFMAFVDDEGRIRILKLAFEKASTIESSIKVLIRRANQETMAFSRAQREYAIYKELFSK